MKILKVPSYKQIPKGVKSLKESFDFDDIFNDDTDEAPSLVSKSAISSTSVFAVNKAKTLKWIKENFQYVGYAGDYLNSTEYDDEGFIKLFGDGPEEIHGKTLDGKTRVMFNLYNSENGICIVDWNTSFVLNSRKLYAFPTFFMLRNINGHFNVSSNNLRSMKGFPTTIKGDCRCSFNFIKNFEQAPKYIGGEFEGKRQKVKTEIPLTDENYRKYINDEPIMENRVMLKNKKGIRFYGEVTNVNENVASVKLDNGSKVKIDFKDLNMLDKKLKNLL